MRKIMKILVAVVIVVVVLVIVGKSILFPQYEEIEVTGPYPKNCVNLQAGVE